MTDIYDQILDAPLPAAYDKIVEDHERTFKAITTIQGSINRITRDLSRNQLKAPHNGKKSEWTVSALFAKKCLTVTAERLKERLGKLNERRKNYRHHLFIDAARRILPDDDFNTIMNATRRRQARRASA